ALFFMNASQREFSGVQFRWMLVAQTLEGVPEVDENGPEDGGAEKDGEEAPARGGVEARDGVRAVKFAEAVFEGGALAAFAGAAEMQALRRGVRRLDCGT
ncbi:MAG: hypothetical protein WA638_18600, partial [Candidatus Acidiferrales bacterium]